MFKRKLLKRALPIILSVAMVFDTLPATALAAEYDGTEILEETDLEETVADDEDVKANDAETREAGVQKESSTVSGQKEDSTPQETEATDMDGNKTETEVITEGENATEKVEAEIKDEILAEGETSSQTDEKETLVAKIVVDDKKVDEYAKMQSNTAFGYTRRLGEEGLVFFTTYVEGNQYYTNFRKALETWFSVEVDGEQLDTLTDKLTYSWAKKGEGEGAANTPLTNAIPKDAGEYVLTISMPEKLEGIYEKLEGSITLSLTIEKAAIELGFDSKNSKSVETAPGKTAQELIDEINENYTIQYKNSTTYKVSRDILDIRNDAGAADPDKKLPLSIFVLDETGARQPMVETDRFDRTKDYVLTVGDIPLTENAAKNYALSIADSYVITVGERQETAVLFERRNPGEDLIEIYDPAKSWTIDDVTAGLFTDEVKDGETVTKQSGAPTVYIHGEDDEEDEYSVILEGAEPEAKWYTRSKVGGQYKADTDAGEIMSEDREYVYKPMKADMNPADAGEYYIIWTYAGDDSAYEKSHSEAVRFTIDPAPVVIKTSQESVDNAGFCDGMSDADVRKALAKLSYDVYPFVKSETTDEMEESSTPLTTRTADFFGTSYRGDVEGQATQYYVPEFVLQRRVVKITEKGEESAVVDPKAVDWRTIELRDTEKLKVIVDKENDEDEFNAIDTAELPNDVSKNNLESVEFEFRVFFTGQKVVYDNNGNKVSVHSVPITDVTTNAANRNYLADITKTTLEKTAVPVTVKEAERVQIVTDAIVDEFIAENGDTLIPQPGEGEEVRDTHQGTLENPAVKVYDQNTLFKDRVSYKKAKVHKYSEDGGIGEELSVSSTDQALQYTWSYVTLDNYEKYLATWDEVQRQYKDFEEYYYDTNLGWGWTDVADGTLASFKSAGLYRLTVTYNDPDHEYQSVKAEVFFKVECQEIIIVPTEKYAKTGTSIDNWKNELGKKKKIGEDFIIYKLPHNSVEEYAALADEAKKAYELPAEEAIAAFEADNGRKPDLTLNSLTWEVLRKEKDPATGLDKDPAVWVKADKNPGDKFDDDFTYGVAAHWTGNLFELESENVQENYTTKDVKTYRETGEEKHHEAAGDIRFYTQQLYVEVDAVQIKALGKEYDGEPVSLADAAKALTFYTDEALTESSKLKTEDIVNLTDEYDPAKVNIYWSKDGYDYANKNAVYGGKYELLLRFAGGELNTAADTPEAQDDAESDTASVIFAPDIEAYYYINTSDDVDGTFIITPREITITPNILSADILAAGEKADTILTNTLTLDERILEKDQKFFTYVEIAAGSFDVTWDGVDVDGTDKEGFAYKYEINKNGGYPAFNSAAQYIIQVDGREIKNPADEYLRFNSTYTVKLANEIVSPLKESYRVTYGTADVTISSRGHADVDSIFENNWISDLSASGIVYNFSNNVYTIRPRGAVKFYDSNVNVIGRDGTEILKNTNILGFRIYAPKEFLNDFTASSKKFVYQNAVWNAGGYFYGSADWQKDDNGRYINVVFQLAKDDTERSFNITWEDGYTELFTLADIVLEEDLTKAVAPKSIAFNGVAGKMAVGEKQQLDLKITKTQLGDVISIRYRIKDGATKNEYISLDPETGVVTALKAGKTATVVEAYPVYKDAKGNFVPVLDSKGKEAKAASTKITVTEVTAATVKKITAQGNSAKLYFTVPDDGYRREIYVVDATKGTQYEERKKWKPADFNKAIDNMANGEWENAGFAIQPIYSYAKNEDLDIKEAAGTYDKKLKAHIAVIENLEAEREYAIYVRNVSAARALDDGSVVVLSASGAVKSFKTTKPQVQKLELGFTIKTDEKDKKNTVTHPVNEDGTIDVNSYTVELSAKKAQLNVYGLFSDKAGGNDAAEDRDLRKYSLVPTLKEEKNTLKKYQLPKLEYVVLDESIAVPFYPDLEKSKYATVSNKGMIGLNGVDLNGEQTVYIYVRDSIQHEDDFGYDAMIALTIIAKPASVTGKKVKMTVGQEIRLSDCLEYKDAQKKKIPNYRSCGVMITKEMLIAAEANGYRIEDFGQNNLTHDWYITAVSPNKKSFDLAVTDFDTAGNPMNATIKLTSAPISAVKGLKVTYVDDKNITINFTHPANSNEADDGSVYDYAIEVKDARGNVVDKKVLSNPNKVFDIDGINAKELKSVQSWIQCVSTHVAEISPKNKTIHVPHTVCEEAFNYYTGTKAKVKTFAYTYTNDKLVRLSAYTISVTPLFENQKADKPATTKTKTTNIPASHKNVDLTEAKPDLLGGESITITSSSMQKNLTGGEKIDEAPYRFISGNTYTLLLESAEWTDPEDKVANKVARDRVTDTLTWKSSNTKVASVKANAGSYTATLKAVNQGRTTISVTSKLTKKVVARWAVTVYAVKDGSSYGGDYEPTWQNGFYEKILALYDPFYEGRLEVLSMKVPLVIDNSDAEGGVRTWISFTAPHFGEYTFSQAATFYDSKDGKIVGNDTNKLFLEANQKVYFSITADGPIALTVTGTELARLTKAHTESAPLEVKAGYIAFTAWEDNVYTFWHNGKKIVIDGETETGMKAGETKFINVADGKMYVTWREVTQELTIGTTPTGTVTIDKDNQVRYISFTANADGEYKFTYQKVDGVAITFSAADGSGLNAVYDSSAASTADAAKETVKRYKLEEGDKVVIELKAVLEITDAAKTFSVSVTVSAAEKRRKIENNTITIPKGTTEIVEYVVPSFTTEKARFKFAVTGETGTEIIAYLDQDYKTLIVSNNTLTVSKTSNIKAGDSIYIKVTAGGSADDKDAKDAVLTVTQVPVDPLTAGSESTKEITNDTEQWYTFTAPEDGYYEFGVTVAQRAESDKTPTHGATFTLYKELFGQNADTYNKNVTTKILSMKTGEMLAVRLNPGYVADIVNEKEDGTTETKVVTSTAKVSVNKLTVTPLALDTASETASIPAKDTKVLYYSFTAAVKADYTISWNPADAKTDNAEVTYFNDITKQSGSQTVAANGSSMHLEAGNVRYIKVAIDDPDSDNAVNGTLLVTAENLNVDALTEGTAYSFELKDEDGSGGKKIVKFTAVESGSYAIVTTVDENAVNGLPYAYPTIETDAAYIITPYDSIDFKKGETKYFTLSYYAGESEVKETKGTITVRSLAEPFTGDQMDVSAAKDITKEYTYIIPESGRYEFKADYDEEKASVQWKDANENTLSDGNYYQKNTKIKVAITGLDEDADAAVKLYRPALITTTQLNVSENEIKVNAGETKYYELNVGSEPKIYEFELSDITGTATAKIERVIDNNNNWTTLPDGGAVDLLKNSKLIIKIQSSSEKKDLSCKLIVTERKELALGENAVHLDAGASVSLTYRAYETGYYSFNAKPGTGLVLETYQAALSKWVTQIGDSFYDIEKLTAKGTRTYILTNEGSGAVDFTVTMAKEEPIELTPGSTTEAVTIPAGQKAHYALKTFKKAEYIIKITDTSKGADLKVTLGEEDVTSELKKIADSVSLEKTLNRETMLTITNDGLGATTVTVELTVSEAQPLTEEAITLVKNESRLISFVATEDTRYLITKDNEDVKMTLVSEQKVSTGKTTNFNTTVKDYRERLLNKGDKLIFKLSYEPAESDKKAQESQTVNVKITKIVPTVIEAEAMPVTIAEKDNKSVWYQFTAAKDAVYTFVLEDTYGNKVSDCMTFYQYFTNNAVGTNAERHMKAGRKVYIKVNYPDAGSYTLKYTTVEAMTETGTKTLDFEYRGEVQEVKFVVPKGGIYKVSATAVRGSFSVAGKVGSQTVVTQFNTNGGTTSNLLKKDDIVTFTVTAAQSGKSSVTLRIAEDNMADTLALGTEHAGVSDTEKDTYYEIRIDKKALYAITVSGEPTAGYYVNDKLEQTLAGTEYEELNKDDRVVIRIEKTTPEKAYTVKIEEVSVTSLDGKNTEEAPYSVSTGEAYYGFTTAKAYVQYKVPEDGNYYIAVQTVSVNTTYGGGTITTPVESTTPAAKAVLYQPGISKLTKDQLVTFTFTNNDPKDEEDPDKDYKEALFKLVIKKAAADENQINLGETKSNSLAARETISYQFKAAEAGKYVIRFNGSNCTLDGYSSENTEKTLAKDATLTLTVSNTSNSKAGSYELTVTKVTPDALTLGVTAQKTLGKGETAYYEFASTETTDTGSTTYQVYSSTTNVSVTCKKVSADDTESIVYDVYANSNVEVTLAKDEKLAFTVKNTTTKNGSFNLTVKKVDYTAVKADTPVSGSLEAYENGYYEFTSEDESTAGTQYQISLDKKSGLSVSKDVKVARMGKDADGNDKLETPISETLSSDNTITLKKGEKLQLTIPNSNSKTAQFELTVEKVEVKEVTYNAITLNEKKTGKLAKDEKAGYELTVSENADYSIYFNSTSPTNCNYVRTYVVRDAEGNPVKDSDGKETTSTESGTLTGSGSRILACKQGDKIRFTISGTDKYELTVKKVEYATFTSGTEIAKTLNAGETAYYQFTSQDDPASGETTTKYQVYGSFSGYTVQTRTVTVGDDGKKTETSWINRSSEYDLKKGQILQFKVTNSSASSQFKLNIAKVVYSPITLGTATEGRLDWSKSGYAYYEFISNDDPAEGQTTTTYQIFGTASYYYSKVTKDADEKLTESYWNYRSSATTVTLAKGERLRFRVADSSNSAEGYNLTVAKTSETTITIGNKTETGSLGRGQELVYTLKYDKETPAAYTVSYEKPINVTVKVTVNGSTVTDMQRIPVSKDDILKITITANNEADSFAFTVNEFKTEPLTLGTLTELKKLALSEAVYCQYTAGEDGTYVVSAVENESGRLMLSYTVSRNYANVGDGMFSDGQVEEIDLKKDDVLLIKVLAPNEKALAAFSCRLMLQKKTTEETVLTTDGWNGTLNQGEVKYFKFTKPDTATAGTKYLVSIAYTAGKLQCTKDTYSITTKANDPYCETVSNNFVLRVANISMYSAADCSIEVQEDPPYQDLGGNVKADTIAKDKTEYYKYTPGSAGIYTLEYNGDAQVQYSTDKTAKKTWKAISNSRKRKITLTNSANTVYLKISHKGTEETCSYKVSITETQDAVTDTFKLRSSSQAVVIGKDTLYLYLDTDSTAEYVIVEYREKYSGVKQEIRLYDDGSAYHGDDMKGDGTYSIMLTPEGKEDTEMQFTAKEDTQTSNTVTVKYYMPLSDDIFSAMADVDNEIENLLSESDFTGKTDDEKLEIVTELLNELMENDKIMDNSIRIDEEHSLVSFQYPGEILGGVMYGEFEEDFNGALNGEVHGTDETGTTDENTSYPERNTYIPASAYSRAINTEQSQEIGKALILNAFPSFETDSDMIVYRTGFYETLKSEWDEAGLKTVLDTDVTVDDFKKLQSYNVVCISTHGSTYKNGPAICLTHKSTKENDKKYEAELSSGQIAKVHMSNVSWWPWDKYYWILPSFFTSQYGEDALDNTFVFSECCMSMGTGKGSNTSEYTYTMANAFTGRGAKAYIGFHNSVFATYSREFMAEYVNTLMKGRTSDEAYNAAVSKHGSNHETWYNKTHSNTLAQYYMSQGETYDPSVHIAYPVHNGNGNAVLINDGLQNGGFESFNSSTTAPKVWSCMGDVRTLTQLGEVAPYGEESRRMAIITTGIGAKNSAVFEGGTEGSMLSQTFFVPYGVETLYFNYNFISEEPMEFVGSQFDDSFGVRISKGGNTVLNQQYESINTSEWKEIEGIDFAGGDSTAFQTDWKTAEIDVSAYSGSVITLSFIIYDVGDQIYDSACVIDNVMLQ